MLAWGLNSIMMKVLVENFQPVTMAAWRIILATVTVFAVLFAMGKVRKLTKKEWKYVSVAAIFNVVVYNYLLSIGMQETSASNGGLIMGIAPLLNMVMAMIFLGMKGTWMKAVGIVIGFMGVSFIILNNGGALNGISMGDLNVFLAIVSQAFSYILISRVSRTIDPRLMTGYMMALGSIGLLIISFITEPQGIQSMIGAAPSVWIVFTISAVVSGALGHLIYNYAVGQVGAAESAIFMNLSPLFALIGSALLLGESITIIQVFGFLLIIAGVLLSSDLVGGKLYQRKMAILNRAK